MPIVYARFEISFHGLEIIAREEIDIIQRGLDEAARKLHPNMYTEGDVEVEWMEHAGDL